MFVHGIRPLVKEKEKFESRDESTELEYFGVSGLSEL